MSNNIGQFNEEIIKGKIKELVRSSVEEASAHLTKIRTNNVIEGMNRRISR